MFSEEFTHQISECITTPNQDKEKGGFQGKSIVK